MSQLVDKVLKTGAMQYVGGKRNTRTSPNDALCELLRMWPLDEIVKLVVDALNKKKRKNESEVKPISVERVLFSAVAHAFEATGQAVDEYLHLENDKSAYTEYLSGAKQFHEISANIQELDMSKIEELFTDSLANTFCLSDIDVAADESFLKTRFDWECIDEARKALGDIADVAPQRREVNKPHFDGFLIVDAATKWLGWPFVVWVMTQGLDASSRSGSSASDGAVYVTAGDPSIEGFLERVHDRLARLPRVHNATVTYYLDNYYGSLRVLSRDYPEGVFFIERVVRTRIGKDLERVATFGLKKDHHRVFFNERTGVVLLVERIYKHSKKSSEFRCTITNRFGVAPLGDARAMPQAAPDDVAMGDAEVNADDVSTVEHNTRASVNWDDAIVDLAACAPSSLSVLVLSMRPTQYGDGMSREECLSILCRKPVVEVEAALKAHKESLRAAKKAKRERAKEEKAAKARVNEQAAAAAAAAAPDGAVAGPPAIDLTALVAMEARLSTEFIEAQTATFLRQMDWGDYVVPGIFSRLTDCDAKSVTNPLCVPQAHFHWPTCVLTSRTSSSTSDTAARRCGMTLRSSSASSNTATSTRASYLRSIISITTRLIAIIAWSKSLCRASA